MIAAHGMFLDGPSRLHNAEMPENGKATKSGNAVAHATPVVRGSNSCYHLTKGVSLMPTVEKVSVAISSDLLEMVKKAVATGEYASASEVIREALRDWKLRQPLRQVEVERLRKAWTDGMASGEAQPFDIEEIKQRARGRFEKNSSPSRNG
jgi:antitoxin ParD1/3/4